MGSLTSLGNFHKATFSFSYNSMPYSGCSDLHGVNPNERKKKIGKNLSMFSF